ncbi:ATP-binding protein [Streptomyces viridochromogenes]|uniref:ATP-binding protein n=1 Tax=Streptomyces viridochromogenes TaxID=1938 RepID=UPI0031D40153
MSDSSATTGADSSYIVKAAPTKNFFVSMLVRDIELLDAVIDLLDNSVDGARRTRSNGDYSGLEVRITFNGDFFRIEDNCGGMPIDVARHYAFRFGRDESRPLDLNSIGQFGVGMKRTLFKLGRHFIVESKTVEDSFRLDVDVEEWQRNPEWDFQLAAVAENESRAESETGTTIVVDRLNATSQTDLREPSWRKRLSSEARLKHRRALDRGMRIYINDEPLQPMPLDLIEDEHVRPYRHEQEFQAGNADTPSTVKLTLLAGVSIPDSSAAGWYVFCNDRLVLGPDKTSTTVWIGAGRQARGGIPAYHDQYARFRGYAFFEAENPAALPWTTTKTGVDTDSPVWRSARQSMILATRPVIDFLNILDKEKTAVRGDARAGHPGLLESEEEEFRAALAETRLQESRRVSIDRVVGSAKFTSPKIDLSALPQPKVWIRYSRDADEVNRVRRLLGGRNERDLPNGELGSRTFDYYLSNEDEEA